MRRPPKQYRPYVEAALEAGCKMTETKKGYRITRDGTDRVAVFHHTPSCPHAVKNMRGDLRRMGVDV